jgi:hypothetical protein
MELKYGYIMKDYRTKEYVGYIYRNDARFELCRSRYHIAIVIVLDHFGYIPMDLSA